eukprot:TRINITY_DN2360_c0_g1_i1.p2 TRINITY_DN2360_c0_g1~~TRINITY_DN2360_c0_g1_i1.p2  ORF type:complete len:142 (+),score=12.25 TRINITY_DN2360_c0_g1_i1:531-956(+)
MSSANLGDSGYMIMRQGEVFYKSTEQQHSFNFPFQLGTGSPTLPKDSDTEKHDIEKGDIVILGSDGLFDNLFLTEIARVVKNASSSTATDIAHALGDKAQRRAHSRHEKSPFSESIAKLGDYYPGGKLDDITIVVGIVNNV